MFSKQAWALFSAFALEAGKRLQGATRRGPRPSRPGGLSVKIIRMVQMPSFYEKSSSAVRPFADQIRHSVCPLPFSICFPESVTPVPTRTEKCTGDDSKAPRPRAIPPRDAVFGVVPDVFGTQVPKNTKRRSAPPARGVWGGPKHVRKEHPSLCVFYGAAESDRAVCRWPALVVF